MKETENFKKTLIKVFVSIFLLALIFYKIDKRLFIESIKGIDFFYLPIILSFIILNYVVSSLRWRKLLSIFDGTEHVKLFTLVKLYFIGAFFNNFLPTSIGGDVYKAFRLGRYIKDHSKAFAATFMERFSGVVILSLFATYGLIGVFKIYGFLMFFGFWVAIFVFFKVIDKLSLKIRKLKEFSDALKVYKGQKGVLIYAFITSIFVQVFSILTQHFIFVSLGFPIPLGFSFFAFPVIILASFFIPSQNSFGVQDALYGLLFLQVGVSLEGAISASIVYHLIRLLVSLLGGVFYAIEK
ncbi:hypothetical protein A2716_03715 [candidate division WWE3 bacterium RIFCSPHIGHO2_01_FULL_40_23]|uniref:Flippase-like domain-containing protein n=1 Tax=candidate division WWE3 bacterium RIFCSPLOWO2_01_FULL_41_18 TaxID=1802625 RepID=A0A1F4VCM1_UNCKA|nr:MAG: hypothetical protein A2716_03715 [candidate division WWE3 bacterium RIFCSPHIGHO2_01_FULL_40_23]OGC54986.1 MAG: hypothetical protein A3A78_03325 [candidate division WWE3 bacterium RIFCSPLOWO2_01_FULL_41_18]